MNAIIQGLLSIDCFTTALRVSVTGSALPHGAPSSMRCTLQSFYDQVCQWGVAPRERLGDDEAEEPSLLLAIVNLIRSRLERSPVPSLSFLPTEQLDPS